MNWESWIDGLGDETKKLLRDEVKRFLRDSLASEDAFVVEQAQKAKRNLERLAAGEITKDQFDSNMADLQDIAYVHAKTQIIRAKAGAQSFADGINDVVRKAIGLLLP